MLLSLIFALRLALYVLAKASLIPPSDVSGSITGSVTGTAIGQPSASASVTSPVSGSLSGSGSGSISASSTSTANLPSLSGYAPCGEFRSSSVLRYNWEGTNLGCV
jgi:hypothetical protein